MRELTPMQTACWFGRSNEAILGGVSAHLYSEFDGQNIDLDKLNLAIKQLYQRHEMLRLKLSPSAIPDIISTHQGWKLEVDDFSIFNKNHQKQKLKKKRESWTHQKLDLTQAQTARFSISLLDDKKFRLHIDTDMIAIDPSSFRILMEDLALFYENENSLLPYTADFFAWNKAIQHDPNCQKQRKRDRLWWKSHLSDIAPAPSIPLKHSNNIPVQSHRLSTSLNTEQRQTLQTLAQQHHLTFSTLLMGIFAYCLGKMTQDSSYRLNIPTFWREPLARGIEQTIGDFANIMILNVDMTKTVCLAQFCQRISKTLTETLAHYQYSGVQVMRDLSRHHGSTQISPVVFTAAVDFQEGELFSERVHRIFGAMSWTISQGPQVALDVQVVNLAGELLINWDIRLDALPETWINLLFENYIYLLQKTTSNPDILNQNLDLLVLKHPSQPKNERYAEKPLNSLQKAYLLGRSTTFPLGGIAMQEYREYAGTLDLKQFKQNLTEIVYRHPSLRTYINEKKLVQYISNEIIVNLTEIDFLGLDPTAVNTKITEFRDSYQHELFDLNQPPWNITIFKLEPNQFRIFVRFDALILDGRAIASLMIELFSDQLPIQARPNIKDKLIGEQTWLDDYKYWKNKLIKNSHSPQLPWTTPLNSISTSTYCRQSLQIKPNKFKQLSDIGARQGLFKNSLIMALILEILSQQTRDLTLTVGIPVLPLYDSSFSNQSTFIVTKWRQNADFIKYAQQLQKNTLEALQHLAFSGVDLARMLYEEYKFAPSLPVVITNGLSWPNLPESNQIKYINGLTQTPQVAIDIRFRLQNDGALIFDIDYAQAAISDQFITDFLLQIDKNIKRILTLGLENINLRLDSVSPQKLFNQTFPDQKNLEQNTINSPNELNIHRDQIMQIYLDHLNIKPPQKHSYYTLFSHLGLRPSHLKMIAKRINYAFSTTLTPLQLIHCKDVFDVEKLVLAQVQQPFV